MSKKLSFLLLQLVASSLVTLCYSQSSAVAGNAKGTIIGGAIMHENDFLFPVGNRDFNYTGGLKVQLNTTMFNGVKPLWLAKNAQAVQYQFMSFVVTAFTPRNIELPNPLLNQRPYASFQGVSLGRVRYNARYKVTSELFLGIMGGQYADIGQTAIHRTLKGRPLPQGWGNQIADKRNIFTPNYHLRFEHVIWQCNNSNVGLTGIADANVGRYMDHIAYGVSFSNASFGDLVFNGESLPKLVPMGARPTPASNNNAGLENEKPKGKKCSDYFAFKWWLSPKIRFVGWNSTLSGIPLSRGYTNPVVVPWKDMRKVVCMAEVGFSFVFWRKLSLLYAWQIRTQEFKNGKTFHMWGQVGIVFQPELKINR